MTYACKAVVAADGLVVDTNTKLTASEAKAFRAAGAGTVVRYGPLPGNSAAGDLDAVELAALTAEGLTVVVVQHPRSPANNTLSAETGKADAEHLIAWAKEIGYLPGVNALGMKYALVLDMEGVKNPGPASVAHAKAWCETVLAADYAAPVYTGYDCGLTRAELAALPGPPQLWSDAATLADRPGAVYAWHQQPQSTLAGVRVDRNTVLVDGAIAGLALAPDVETDASDPTQPMPPLPFNPESQPPPAA